MSIGYRKLLFEEKFPEMEEEQGNFIPLELEHHIQIVLSMLKEAIEKFKISLILPKILENPKVLHQFLKNTKYSQCLELVKEFRKKIFQKSQPPINSNDNETLKIIDYFQENFQVVSILPNWLEDIDNTETCFLKAFKDVCKVAEERFQRSAATDLRKEKRLHVLYVANEETINIIKEINEEMQQKKTNLRWKHAAKSGVIQKLEEELAFNQSDNNLFVKREMYKSQREIQSINNSFAAKQEDLEKDFNKVLFAYQTKLKKDLNEEKRVRDERNKIQLQLQALAKKYDQTIYDRYVEEILLQEEYNKHKQEFEEFLKEYQKEEQTYEELVVKQQRLQEAKALIFAYTRAAIKIQRWWRIMQKRMAKEKKRQRKKLKTAKAGKYAKQAKKRASQNLK